MRHRVTCLALIALLATTSASAAPTLTYSQATPMTETSATPGATAVPAGATPPASGAASLGIGIAGNAFDLVAPGTPGEVSVVATGPLPTDEMATQLVLVRNLTGAPVGRTSIIATARDASGALVALGASFLPTPVLVPDGGLAMMRVRFQPAQIPAGAMVEYQVWNAAPRPEVETLQGLALAIDEMVFMDGRYQGTVTNTAEVDAWGGSVLVMCFGPDGTVTATGAGTVDPFKLSPGATGTFAVSTAAECDRYIVAAGT